MTVNGPELAYAADIMVGDYFCVKPGDILLITADTATDRDVVDAVMNAAHTIGAKPAVMTSPQLPYQGALANDYISEPLAAAMRQCDAWIDLQFPYVAGSDAHDEAMKSNRMRYLLSGDLTAGGLIRMFGKVGPGSALRGQGQPLRHHRRGHRQRGTDHQPARLRRHL